MKKIIIPILILVVLIIGGFWFKDMRQIPGAAVNPITEDFVSEKLGIAFNYKPDPSDQTYKTKTLEEGNVVYVYDEGIIKPQDGQFVEVFFKDINETLKDAIRRLIMPDTPTNCKISIRDDGKGFVSASISYENLTPEENKLLEEDWYYWLELNDRCTPKYSASNGLSYFAYYPE